MEETTLPAIKKLSPRELEVVQLIADGASNKKIGDHLGISTHTAKYHVNGIMKKLGVDTRAAAVAAAFRAGVVK